MKIADPWRDRLKVGDVIAVRQAASPFSSPYRLCRVTKVNAKTVALEGVHGLVRRAAPWMVEATAAVRDVIEKHELREWAKYHAEPQILKLTKAQQTALKSLVSRMAADPAVLS